VIVAVMGWDSPVEVDRERLQRLFPPGAAEPGGGAAELLQVADRQVEDFEGGLFGGELAAVAVTLRSRALIDSIRSVV
jgi:hypothetical protein